MRWLLVCLFLVSCYAPPASRDASSRGLIFLPIIQSPRCLLSDEAQTIANLLVKDSRQQRSVMRCNERLVAAAHKRAMSMAILGYFAHCDPSGKCANTFAQESGCQLPANYVKNGNNIESLIAGPNKAVAAYKLIALSPSHANHLFGIGEFFRAQTEYGIAAIRVPGSKFEYYYVFLIGRCLTP